MNNKLTGIVEISQVLFTRYDTILITNINMNGILIYEVPNLIINDKY